LKWVISRSSLKTAEARDTRAKRNPSQENSRAKKHLNQPATDPFGTGTKEVTQLKLVTSQSSSILLLWRSSSRSKGPSIRDGAQGCELHLHTPKKWWLLLGLERCRLEARCCRSRTKRLSRERCLAHTVEGTPVACPHLKALTQPACLKRLQDERSRHHGSLGLSYTKWRLSNALRGQITQQGSLRGDQYDPRLAHDGH